MGIPKPPPVTVPKGQPPKAPTGTSTKKKGIPPPPPLPKPKPTTGVPVPTGGKPTGIPAPPPPTERDLPRLVTDAIRGERAPRSLLEQGQDMFGLIPQMGSTLFGHTVNTITGVPRALLDAAALVLPGTGNADFGADPDWWDRESKPWFPKGTTPLSVAADFINPWDTSNSDRALGNIAHNLSTPVRHYLPLASDVAEGLAEVDPLGNSADKKWLWPELQEMDRQGRSLEWFTNYAGAVATVAPIASAAIGAPATVAAGSAIPESTIFRTPNFNALEGSAARPLAATGERLPKWTSYGRPVGLAEAAARPGSFEDPVPANRPGGVPSIRTTRGPTMPVDLENPALPRDIRAYSSPSTPQTRTGAIPGRGTGIAGYYQRSRGIPINEIENSTTLNRLATAKSVIDKASFTANWLDPTQPFLWGAGKVTEAALKRVAPGLSRGAAMVIQGIDAKLKIGDKIQLRDAWNTSREIIDEARTVPGQVETPAIQYFTEQIDSVDAPSELKDVAGRLVLNELDDALANISVATQGSGAAYRQRLINDYNADFDDSMKITEADVKMWEDLNNGTYKREFPQFHKLMTDTMNMQRAISEENLRAKVATGGVQAQQGDVMRRHSTGEAIDLLDRTTRRRLLTESVRTSDGAFLNDLSDAEAEIAVDSGDVTGPRDDIKMPFMDDQMQRHYDTLSNTLADLNKQLEERNLEEGGDILEDASLPGQVRDLKKQQSFLQASLENLEKVGSERSQNPLSDLEEARDFLIGEMEKTLDLAQRMDERNLALKAGTKPPDMGPEQHGFTVSQAMEADPVEAKTYYRGVPNDQTWNVDPDTGDLVMRGMRQGHWGGDINAVSFTTKPEQALLYARNGMNAGMTTGDVLAGTVFEVDADAVHQAVGSERSTLRDRTIQYEEATGKERGTYLFDTRLGEEQAEVAAVLGEGKPAISSADWTVAEIAAGRSDPWSYVDALSKLENPNGTIAKVLQPFEELQRQAQEIVRPESYHEDLATARENVRAVLDDYMRTDIAGRTIGQAEMRIPANKWRALNSDEMTAVAQTAAGNRWAKELQGAHVSMADGTPMEIALSSVDRSATKVIAGLSPADREALARTVTRNDFESLDNGFTIFEQWGTDVGRARTMKDYVHNLEHQGMSPEGIDAVMSWFADPANHLPELHEWSKQSSSMGRDFLAGKLGEKVRTNPIQGLLNAQKLRGQGVLAEASRASLEPVLKAQMQAVQEAIAAIPTGSPFDEGVYKSAGEGIPVQSRADVVAEMEGKTGRPGGPRGSGKGDLQSAASGAPASTSTFLVGPNGVKYHPESFAAKLPEAERNALLEKLHPSNVTQEGILETWKLRAPQAAPGQIEPLPIGDQAGRGRPGGPRGSGKPSDYAPPHPAEPPRQRYEASEFENLVRDHERVTNKLLEVEDEIKKVTAERDATAFRLANLPEILRDQTKQAELRRVNEKHIGNMKNTVRTITGQKLGGVRKKQLGGGVFEWELTGLAGELAHKYGGTLADDLLKSYRDFKLKESQLGPNQSLADLGIDGDSIFAHVMLENLYDRVGEADQGRLAEAIARDQLEAMIARIDRTSNEGTATSYTQTGSRIDVGPARYSTLEREAPDVAATMTARQLEGPILGQSLVAPRRIYLDVKNKMERMMLDPRLKGAIGQEHIDSWDAAHRDWMASYRHVVDNIMDESLTPIPAALRTPLQRGRHQFRVTMDLALDLMDGKERFASDLILRNAEQMSTSLIQHNVEMGRNSTTYMSGMVRPSGGGFSGTKLVNSMDLVVAEPGTTLLRSTGTRSQEFREVVGSNVKSMQEVIFAQAMQKIAVQPGFTKAIGEVTSPEGVTMAQWVADVEKQTGHVPTMRDVRVRLEDLGYTIIDLTGPDRLPSPNIIPGQVPRVPFEMDAAGKLRIRGVDGLGRPLEQLDEKGRVIDAGIDPYGEAYEGMEMRVMRSDLAGRIKDYLDTDGNSYVRKYDQAVQAWKIATLAWSTTWTVYNAMGNIMMGLFGAGMTPGQMYDQGARLYREMAYASEQVARKGPNGTLLKRAARDQVLREFAPPRLYAHGQAWSEVQLIGSLTQGEGKLENMIDYMSNRERGVMGRVTDTMYQINELTDNFFRTVTYMNELDKNIPKMPGNLIDEKGNLRNNLTVEEQAQWAEVNTQYHDSIEKSIRQTLVTMGDFTKLSPIERKLIKRVFPFWPWMRHQMIMSYRLPLNNPFRYAFMMGLTDRVGEDIEGDSMFDLMSGKYNVSSHIKSLLGFDDASLVMSDFSGGDPFLALGSSPMGREPGSDTQGSSIFAPDALLRSMSPVITKPIGAITGYDVSAAQKATRPQDQFSQGAFGTDLAQSAARRVVQGTPGQNPITGRLGGLAEMAYSLAGAAPSLSSVRNLALSAIDSRPRYDSGEVIPYADPQPGNWIYRLGQAVRPPGLPRVYDRQRDVALDRDALLAAGD